MSTAFSWLGLRCRDRVRSEAQKSRAVLLALLQSRLPLSLGAHGRLGDAGEVKEEAVEARPAIWRFGSLIP